MDVCELIKPGTLSCALPDDPDFFERSQSQVSAIGPNIVMHKTSQVESFSILLLKPNLRIEL